MQNTLSSDMTVEEQCQVHKQAILQYLPGIEARYNLAALNCQQLVDGYSRKFNEATAKILQGGSANALLPELLYMEVLADINAQEQLPKSNAKGRREAWR